MNQIKYCPSGCYENPSIKNIVFEFNVQCKCGWKGPTKSSPEEAIQEWNFREDGYPFQ